MPRSACSNLPICFSVAPVNDPFSWPNSSDSISSSGIAAQLTCTNRSRLRRLLRWIARATSSLPVPLSPRISTRRVRRRGALDRVPDLPQQPALADHLVAGFDGALERAILVLQARAVQRVLDRDEDAFARQRLLDEVERAELRRLDRRAHRAMPRDHDDRERLVRLLDLLQHFEPVDPRHLDVEEDEVGRFLLDEREPFRPARRLLDVVALVLENHPHRIDGSPPRRPRQECALSSSLAGGLRPAGPPYTFARGGPVPRSAHVAHSLPLARSHRASTVAIRIARCPTEGS